MTSEWEALDGSSVGFPLRQTDFTEKERKDGESKLEKSLQKKVTGAELQRQSLVDRSHAQMRSTARVLQRGRFLLVVGILTIWLTINS